MVSVLPPGIDVRKLQRSHSRDKSGRAFIRFTKPSFFRFTYPVYLSDLACSHQTLSDISLDRSEVKSDKLLDVNAAYLNTGSVSAFHMAENSCGIFSNKFPRGHCPV